MAESSVMAGHSHWANISIKKGVIDKKRSKLFGKLSRAMLARLVQAEATSVDDYRADLDERNRVRAVYNGLAAQCHACVTLAAPAAAPVGLGSTGDPIFAVPFSLLGVPAISLPLLHEQGLPRWEFADRIPPRTADPAPS